MSDPKFKPLSVEDFDISPEDMKTIVNGAQTFLPPVPDDEVDTEPKTQTS